MIRHLNLGDNPFSRTRKLKELLQNGGVTMAGNSKLKIYGRLTCSSGKHMKAGNRVFFVDEQEAKATGYRPCGHCMLREYELWKASASLLTHP